MRLTQVAIFFAIIPPFFINNVRIIVIQFILVYI